MARRISLLRVWVCQPPACEEVLGWNNAFRTCQSLIGQRGQECNVMGVTNAGRACVYKLGILSCTDSVGLS